MKLGDAARMASVETRVRKTRSGSDRTRRGWPSHRGASSIDRTSMGR
jgi:hypothetical protein